MLNDIDWKGQRALFVMCYVLSYKPLRIFESKEDWCSKVDHIVKESSLTTLVAQICHGGGHHYNVIAASTSLVVFIGDFEGLIP